MGSGGARLGAGRKPRPTTLIDADAKRTKREKFDRRENEIECKQNDLKCPTDMTPDAKKEWKRVIGLYNGIDAKILTDLDIQALRMYCEQSAIYNNATKQLAQFETLVTTNVEGQKIINYLTKLIEKSSKIIISLSEQLCLTPVGRARLGLANAGGRKTKKANPNSMESFMANMYNFNED